MKHLRKYLITILLLPASVWPVSLDQSTSERILRENRYFLEFIDKSTANFGTEKDKENLKAANTHNFQANLKYLQGDYVATYKKIRLSQELLKGLYVNLLDQYRIDARRLLDISAPIIVQSRDKKAQLFLRLGYRDLESSKQFRDYGYNYNRFLFSNKIRYYIDGIKRSRRAKRFAFLALLESKTPYEEKEEYRTQTIDEALRVTEKEEIKDFERVKNTMRNMINRKLFSNTYNFFLHHDDNYGYISGKNKSIIKNMTDELAADANNDLSRKNQLNPQNKSLEQQVKDKANDTKGDINDKKTNADLLNN